MWLNLVINDRHSGNIAKIRKENLPAIYRIFSPSQHWCNVFFQFFYIKILAKFNKFN
jgi:hypothetical protein